MTTRGRKPEIVNSLFTAAFDGLRAEYQAARETRFTRKMKGVRREGSGADYHMAESDYLKIIERSRMHERDNVVVDQGVRRLVSNVLQQGMKLEPDTGSDALDRELVDRWTAWSEDPEECHVAGELTFHDIAKLTMRSVVRDGDCFHLPLATGQLEPIEAHRCRGPRKAPPELVLGVLLNEYRRRMEYWFTRDDIDPNARVKDTDIRRVAARGENGHRQVYHVYLPRRFSQTRGITAFTPINDMLAMHDDIQFAKLVQQQIVSCFAILRSRELGFDGGTPGKTGEQRNETLADGATTVIEGVAPGLMVASLPGEKLEGFSPSVPNAEFFAHAMLMLSFVAINLDLPLAVLMLDPSKTNFSGWRGAIDQARMVFRDLQQWLIRSMYRPVYLWKIRQWAEDEPSLAARLNANPSALMRHTWAPPTWAYIEPSKDAQADATIIHEGLDSRRGVLARRGIDIETVDVDTINDNVRLITAAAMAAQQINKQFPEARVDWREIARLAPPVGVPVTVDAADTEQPDDDEPDHGDEENQT